MSSIDRRNDRLGDEIRLVDCPTCGNRVPDDKFCGACGGHLVEVAGPRRRSTFAADPSEAVVRPWLASMLFPYLPHRALVPFRLALLIGVLVVILLGLLRSAGPVIVASAALLPALYLLYLYEAGVYEDEPWRVTLATFVLGGILGLAWALLIGPLATQALILASAGVMTPGDFLVGAIAVPLTAQVFMLVGPAVLYRVGRFREPLDGFTFGAASALGFGFAVTLSELPQFLGQPLDQIEPVGFAIDALRRGVVGPLVWASLTGLIAASIWSRRERRPRIDSPLAEPAIIIAVAVLIQVGLGIVDVTLIDGRLQFVAWLVTAVALVVATRLALHEILLSEARTATIGPEMTCPNCAVSVLFMPFCPNCGIARRATPKIGRLEAPAAPGSARG